MCLSYPIHNNLLKISLRFREKFIGHWPSTINGHWPLVLLITLTVIQFIQSVCKVKLIHESNALMPICMELKLFDLSRHWESHQWHYSLFQKYLRHTLLLLKIFLLYNLNYITMRKLVRNIFNEMYIQFIIFQEHIIKMGTFFNGRFLCDIQMLIL